MIILIQKMIAHPEKRSELVQTLCELGPQTKSQEGCLSYSCHQDIENDKAFILLSEWETKMDLDKYLRSDYFGVLLGAKSLLKRSMEIKLNTISHTIGIEAVRAVRGQLP